MAFFLLFNVRIYYLYFRFLSVFSLSRAPDGLFMVYSPQQKADE